MSTLAFGCSLVARRLSLVYFRQSASTFGTAFGAAKSWVGGVSVNRLDTRFFSREKDIHEEVIDEDDDALVAPPTIHPRSPVPFLHDRVDDEEDPFGVNFDDGSEQGKVGKKLPPKYKRDSATGRLTGDIEQELTDEEKRILKADPLEQDQLMVRRLEQHWKEQGLDTSGMPKEVFSMGKRVRDAEIGLNVFGRSVKAQASEEELDDGSTLGRDESGLTQNLTKQEYEAYAKFMKTQFDADVSEDDIPVQAGQKKSVRQENAVEDPDELNLSLKWLSSRARREMDDLLDDNPFSDLMPGDLSPTRLVNRRRAKPIPTKLLHHNNIELLRRFLTPTGQVMNRVQTRLGARDQRHVAKLIKRSRALGLLPHAGQVKVETHGWKHAPDLHKDRPWEKELVRRGLVIKRSRDTTNTAK